jgi:hypothetical protein
MARKKTWKELNSGQKAKGALMIGIQLGLQAVALKDLKSRSAAEVNGPKAAWVAGTFVNFLGPIAYFLFGRRKA